MSWVCLAMSRTKTVSLQVACETLRDVILERKGPKDVVLAVHRLNQTLLKARTFAEAEDLVTGTLLSGWKGGKALPSCRCWWTSS